MASGIFAILDDIAALMDDVAAASKIATKKTAGILGDDLAVNAEKATGFLSSRELPVLWKITKGSLLNKLIIIPIVFLLQVYLPVAITIVLILGGFYLAYEGVEKIVEWLFHRQHAPEKAAVEAVAAEGMEAENRKVKSAISTDFILSIEIVIIALSTVMDKPLTMQIITVSVVALLATIGVYGIVALIVRMDDAGFLLIKQSKGKGFFNGLGKGLVAALPIIIRVLGVVGTIALLLVSGGIFAHKVYQLEHILLSLPDVLRELVFGLTAGIVALVLVSAVKALLKLFKK
ncbi:MAG TPA: DUF808 family protein [Edaphocola sp.]|nr:DUF808 family protein [Edaphocola sp.]